MSCRPGRAGARWIVLCAIAACHPACQPPAEPETVPATDQLAPAPEPAEVADLEAALAARPDDPEIRRRLAFQLYREQRVQQAIEQFAELVRRDPDDPARLHELALVYASAGLEDQAEATYRRLLALAPDRVAALVHVAHTELKRGRTQEAIDLYRRALALRGDHLIARYYLADALQDAGLADEAYATFAEVSRLEPANPRELELHYDTLHELASAELLRGDAAQAEARLLQLLQARPDHPAAHYTYAQLLIRTNRAEQAGQELELHSRLLARRESTEQMSSGQ